MSGVVMHRGVPYAVTQNTRGQAQITRDRDVVVATDRNGNGIFERDEFVNAATNFDRGLAGLRASSVDTGIGAVDRGISFDQGTRNRAAGVSDINQVISWPQDHDRVQDLILEHLAGRPIDQHRVNQGSLFRSGFDYAGANDQAEAAAAPYIAAGDSEGMWRAYVESYVSSFKLGNVGIENPVNNIAPERWDTVVDSVMASLGYL